jgi:hypothetical protein
MKHYTHRHTEFCLEKTMHHRNDNPHLPAAGCSLTECTYNRDAMRTLKAGMPIKLVGA